MQIVKRKELDNRTAQAIEQGNIYVGVVIAIDGMTASVRLPRFNDLVITAYINLPQSEGKLPPVVPTLRSMCQVAKHADNMWYILRIGDKEEVNIQADSISIDSGQGKITLKNDATNILDIINDIKLAVQALIDEASISAALEIKDAVAQGAAALVYIQAYSIRKAAFNDTIDTIGTDLFEQ